MALSEEQITEAVERYGRERDRYIKLAARVADLTRTAILEESVIRAQVTSRTKSVRSFQGKLRRFAMNPEKNYTSVEEIFAGISDLAGVRVATYRPEDQEQVEKEICKVFKGPGDGNVVPDPKDKIDFANARFYRGVHCQVCLPEQELIGDFENLRGTSCEVQICSMMAHVWNEIEHDISYKPQGGGPGLVEKGLLQALGHLTLSGDATISRLIEATEVRLEEQTGDFTDVHDFVARLRKNFPGLELAVNAGVAFDVAMILELSNPGRIAQALGTGLPDIAVAQARVEQFNLYLDRIGVPDVRLNPRSADVLTVALLQKNAQQVLAYFADRTTTRPPRPATLSKRYVDFLARLDDPAPESEAA
ncbi:GTP pyrophosphokinase [Sphingosinicella terrae]|uniref:GTP pyrophosphokinase n=1 Tax=Sphingosinicella terrae TaxID=2172047 RepID=UPI000E0E00AC|nr:RelA/SpoT domain-containing protein [Sphingosinicella terrae]